MRSTPVQGSLNATTDAPVSISTSQCRSLGIKITGSYTGTLSFQATIDGTNWDAAPATTVSASPATVTSTTAAGIWQMNCSEFQQVRVNPTAFTPGTPAVVTLSPSVAPMRRSGGGASSLLTNLKAYYSFTSLLADSAGSNTLVNVNGVTQAAGLLGQAASFTAASSQKLTMTGGTDWVLTGKDWTITGWVKPTTSTPLMGWIGESLGGGAWSFTIRSGQGLQITLYDGGFKFAEKNLASWSTSAFTFLSVQFNATTKVASCDINNSGTPGTVTLTNQIAGEIYPVIISHNNSGFNFFDGLMDEIGLWTSSPGGGGVLTPTQLTNLYNAGAGVTYPFTGVP